MGEKAMTNAIRLTPGALYVVSNYGIMQYVRSEAQTYGRAPWAVLLRHDGHEEWHPENRILRAVIADDPLTVICGRAVCWCYEEVVG